jgi:hypothetical protein
VEEKGSPIIEASTLGGEPHMGPDPTVEESDGYGSDTTYTGFPDLVDSSSEREEPSPWDLCETSSSEDEVQCQRACQCKGKVEKNLKGKKARRRWNRRQG